ncbi:MAG: hypothetical protein Hens2KO_27790 [Henriciella sp.]
MSWVTQGLDLIDFSSNSKTLELLLNEINKILKQPGGAQSIENVLEQISSDDAIDQAIKDLAARYLDDSVAGTAAAIATLRHRLWKIEAMGDGKRTFGWPALKTSGNRKIGDFSVDLSAEGGMSFEVLNADDPEDTTRTRFTVKGQVAPKLSGNVNFGRGSIGGGASASLKRSVVFDCAYDDDVRAGRALVDTLGRLCDPSDFSGVIKSFQKSAPAPLSSPDGTADEDGIIPEPLSEIKYAGGQSLAASIQGGVSAPFSAATVSASTKFGIKLGSAFDVSIRRGSKDSLIVRAAGNSAKDSSFTLGLGASVGLSAIAPGLAKQILDRVASTKPLLDKIDSVIDDAETWLKPGSAIQDHLVGLIDAEISGGSVTARALKGFLKDAFGAGDGTSAKALANIGAEKLSELIDDATNLFGVANDDSSSFDGILSALSESIIQQVAKKADIPNVEKALASVLSDAQKHINRKLEDAVQSLDDEANSVISRIIGRDVDAGINELREALQKARRLLDKVSKHFADASLEALAIRMSWERAQGDESEYSLSAEYDRAAAKAYSQAIKKPGEAISKLLASDTLPKGVTLRPDDNWISDTLSSSSSLEWNIAILGVSRSTKTSSFSKIKVRRVPGAVGVITDLSASRADDAFLTDETRKMSFVSLLNFGAANEASSKLGLELSQVDDNLKVKEARTILSAFERAGILDDDVSELVLDAIRSDRMTNEEKLAATLDVSLGLPGEKIWPLINSAVHREDVDQIAAESLAVGRAMQNEIDRRLGEWNFDKDTSDSLLLAMGKTKRKRNLKDYEQILQNARRIAELLENEISPTSVAERRRAEKRAVDYWNRTADMVSGLRVTFGYLAEARKIVDQALKNNPSLSDEEVTTLQRRLSDTQKKINKRMKPWLDPGDTGIWEERPERAASLFLALQELSVTPESAAKPKLLVGYAPKGKPKKMFISK